MKARILKNVYAFIAGMSLLLACAEGETLGSQLIWSSSMLIVCVGSVRRMDHYMTEEEKQEEA